MPDLKAKLTGEFRLAFIQKGVNAFLTVLSSGISYYLFDFQRQPRFQRFVKTG